MVPVLSRKVPVNIDKLDIAYRMLPVASPMAQRVVSMVDPSRYLTRYDFETSHGKIHNGNVLDYLRMYGSFYLEKSPFGSIKPQETIEKQREIVNKRFGYKIMEDRHIDLFPYHQLQNFFNPNAFVSKEVFLEIYQHFQNLQDVGFVNYLLEGDLKDMDSILTQRNFRGDPLMSAIKAKIYLETLMLQQECASAAQAAQQDNSQDGDQEDEGQSNKQDLDNKDESEEPSFYQAVRDAHREKEVFDKYSPYTRQAALEENDLQQPDLFEQHAVNKFAQDKGILTEKKIDLSFDSVYKTELERDRNGEMVYVPNKTLSLKGVPKSSLANPMFKSKHAGKKLLKKDYFKRITKNELVVFILVDVSGSMCSLGKIRVRNAILMDRFDAVMKNRCQLYVQGYLTQAIGQPTHIKDLDTLTQWTHLRPNGGDTDVQNAVRTTIQGSIFQSYLKKGLKGEIIIINDGQDRMPPFTAPQGVKIHAMQLADVGDNDEERYIKQDLKKITEMNNGRFVFFNTHKTNMS